MYMYEDRFLTLFGGNLFSFLVSPTVWIYFQNILQPNLLGLNLFSSLTLNSHSCAYCTDKGLCVDYHLEWGEEFNMDWLSKYQKTQCFSICFK